MLSSLEEDKGGSIPWEVGEREEVDMMAKLEKAPAPKKLLPERRQNIHPEATLVLKHRGLGPDHFYSFPTTSALWSILPSP